MLTAVVVIIFVALVFDFINGFHDAANSIATVVSTRVLTPLQAVVWAAFFNFVAAFGFGVSVARTVGKGVVDTAATVLRVPPPGGEHPFVQPFPGVAEMCVVALTLTISRIRRDPYETCIPRLKVL